MITFEIHTNAPELNKIFKNGCDITKLFAKSTLIQLNKDYNHNVKQVRKVIKPFNDLRSYKLIALRPNGSKEIRFCNVRTVKDAHEQFKKVKLYYNIDGTKLEFIRIFKY